MIARFCLRLSRCGWLLAGLSGFAHCAYAIDVGSSTPPAAVADAQLTIGGRSLRLPEGGWNYIARTQRDLTIGGVDRVGHSYTAYAADVRDGTLRAGVVLYLSADSIHAGQWNVQPCKVEGEMYRDDFGGGVKFPECLLVFKRGGHLNSGTGELFTQAQQWLASSSVSPLGPVYEVVYSRYGTSDVGVVRVFIPRISVKSDADMVAWARLLPSHLKEFFERRTSQATLPPLPLRSKS